MASDDEEDTGATAPAGGEATVPIGSTEAPPEVNPAPSGPDFTSMVRPPSDMAPVQKQLADIQRARAATNAANADEVTRRLDQDRARMEAAYKVSAAMPPELQQGWDAKSKMAEHYTDPVTAFGSVGSVFAMLASSFAGLPMEAGLNAGAAAINAIHAGDAKAYEKEYEGWKSNVDLAIKRHDIQRQAYNDATNLMNSNLNAGRTKMELAATRFGDQKAQALLDAGMDKELFELFDSRNKAALATQSQWDKVQLEHEKVQDLRNDPRYQSADPAQKSAAVAEWTQRWSPTGAQKMRYDAEADYMAARKRENPDWTPSDMLQWKKEFATAEEGEGETGGMKANTPEKAFVAAKVKEIQDREGRDPTPEERLAFKREWTDSQTKKSASSGAQKATAIQEIFDNAAASGKPITMAEATKQYGLTTATPSGNRLDDIDKQIGMYDNGKKAIDSTLAMIDKHVGSVGAAGYATRVGERVGNIFGSNETDRSQIAHDIKYLQTIAPRLLQDASSRGLKAEADKINSLIAGLNLGDTTANTKRALTEVRDLWDKMQGDNLARRRGTPNLPGADGTTPSGGSGGSPASKKAPWLNDPVVKPRADAGSESAYV